MFYFYFVFLAFEELLEPSRKAWVAPVGAVVFLTVN